MSDRQDEMNQIIQKEAERAKAAQNRQTENISFVINPQSHVDQTKFQQAIAKYAEGLKAQNKMNLVSILTKGKSTFNHNEWSFVVENDIEFGWLEREKELLPFLRRETDTPDLFLKCSVDETYTNSRDQIPYTDEDKLKAMGEKNPNLVELQRIFKTRIVY